MELLVILLCCGFGIAGIDGAPTIRADPEVIRLGMTQHLSLSCTIPKHGLSGLAWVLSMTLSSTTNASKEEYTTLATVNRVLDRKLIEFPPVGNALASGHIGGVGDSFLRLSWNNPTSKHAAKYKCVVHGFDENGGVVFLEETVDVQAENPDKTLLDDILGMSKRIDKNAEDIVVLKNEVGSLRETVERNTKHTERLVETVEKLESRLDAVQESAYETNTRVYGIQETLGEIGAQILGLKKETAAQISNMHTVIDTQVSDIRGEILDLKNATDARLDKLTEATSAQNMFKSIEYFRRKESLTNSLGLRSSSEFRGHRYYHPLTLDIARNANDISGAENLCKRIDGHLVEIDDMEELNFVVTFAKSLSGFSSCFHISGTDAETEGRWVHQRSQELLSFEKWHSSEPNGGTSENCLIICTSDSMGHSMGDYLCSLSSGSIPEFICEVP